VVVVAILGAVVVTRAVVVVVEVVGDTLVGGVVVVVGELVGFGAKSPAWAVGSTAVAAMTPPTSTISEEPNSRRR
jgi:hypothetical protein